MANSILDTLSFTDVSRQIGTVDKLTQAKQRIMEAIDNQISYAKQAIKGQAPIAKRVTTVTDEDGAKRKIEQDYAPRVWWFEAPDENVYLNVRYGNRPLALTKAGKVAIKAGALKDVPKVLETVKKAVEAGELDALLKQVSKREKKS